MRCASSHSCIRSCRGVRWPGPGLTVLSHDRRIALDGSPAETVDAEAKDLATKQLAQLAARKAAKKAAEAAAPAVVKPKPVAPAPPTERPPNTPEQLRGRVRASLLRRSA
jgi:sRNA-binding protein